MQSSGIEERSDTTIQGDQGLWDDGRRFYIYRFILYSYGFTATKAGSIDGCNILPLGVPPDSRTLDGSIRRIWITLSGISSREMLLEVIKDVVKVSTEGIPDRDDRVESFIFLDHVAYLGDYPAVTELIYVKGLTGYGPCDLCFFRRKDVSRKRRAVFDGTQHSGSLSTRRSTLLCSSILNSGANKVQLGSLVLHAVSEGEGKPSPFQLLSKRLEELRALVPRNLHGEKFAAFIFDAYLSCIVSPDHLFFGVSQNLMSSCIHVLSPGVLTVTEARGKWYL